MGTGCAARCRAPGRRQKKIGTLSIYPPVYEDLVLVVDEAMPAAEARARHPDAGRPLVTRRCCSTCIGASRLARAARAWLSRSRTNRRANRSTSATSLNSASASSSWCRSSSTPRCAVRRTKTTKVSARICLTRPFVQRTCVGNKGPRETFVVWRRVEPRLQSLSTYLFNKTFRSANVRGQQGAS